jgi:hypothetical protein
MYQNHSSIEVMLRERHSELLDQAKILSQLRGTKPERRENIGLGAFIKRVKLLSTPGRIEAQPVMPAKDFVPGPECQVC